MSLKSEKLKMGNNEYNNLNIACCKCNLKKYNKTEIEYRGGQAK